MGSAALQNRSVSGTRPRRPPGASRRWAWALLALPAGALMGLLASWAAQHERTALIVALAVVGVMPFVVRGLQGRFDPFEPINLLALGILVLFAARPWAELHYGLATYGPYFTRPGFNGALLVALVGTASMFAGYFLVPGKRIVRRLPSLPRRWDTARSVRFAAWMLVLAAVLMGLFAATSGGLHTITTLYRGRQTAFDSATLRQSSGWIYLGPYLTIPASIILLAARSRRPTPGRTALLVVSVLAAVALTVPRGDRTFILTLILPLVTLPFLRRRTRPRVWSIVACIVVAVLAINVLRLERNVDTRHDPLSTAFTALTTPTQQLKDFITGPDPSLFTVLSVEYEAVPRDIHFSPGITPLSILAGPVPGKVWADKPAPALVNVTNHLFYQASLVSRASLGPSTFGDMYADFGFVTVALYSLILGGLIRIGYDYFRAHQGNAAAQLIFAASLPLTIIFIRNNLTDTLGHSVALVVPIIVCVWICARPRGALLPRLRTGRLGAALSSGRG